MVAVASLAYDKQKFFCGLVFSVWHVDWRLSTCLPGCHTQVASGPFQTTCTSARTLYPDLLVSKVALRMQFVLETKNSDDRDEVR